MAQNILVVEDDPEQAKLFIQVLQMSGYTAVLAEDAVGAQTQIQSTSFALLLVDWDLPGEMKGDDLITWAKAHVPGIKTILFSNHPQVDDIAAACGADASFKKTEGILKMRQLVMTMVPLGVDHA